MPTSWNLLELSHNLARPREFFRFDYGAVSWCYVTGKRGDELDGIEYLPAAIKRSAIKTGAERRKLGITITMPRDLAVLSNWWPYPPRDRIRLTVMARNEKNGEVRVRWMGRALTPKIMAGRAELPCEPTMTTARSASLSRCFQRGCGLALYSQGLGMCNVDKAEHEVPLELASVDGTTLTSPGFALLPSGRFAGGFIEWTRADGLVEQRSIMSHTGTGVTIDYGAEDLLADLAVSAYPSCHHDTDDCENYFHNAIHYGGDPYMTSKNPFGPHPIW